MGQFPLGEREKNVRKRYEKQDSRPPREWRSQFVCVRRGKNSDTWPLINRTTQVSVCGRRVIHGLIEKILGRLWRCRPGMISNRQSRGKGKRNRQPGGGGGEKVQKSTSCWMRRVKKKSQSKKT